MKSFQMLLAAFVALIWITSCSNPLGTSVQVSVPYAPGSSGAPVLVIVETPAVTSVSPSSGPMLGGTQISIVGANFLTGATVTLSGQNCSGVTVVNSTLITCTTPGHTNGVVSVQVTNTNTKSSILTNAFTYIATSNPYSSFGLASGGGVSTGTHLRLRGVAGGMASQTQPTGGNIRMYPGLINITTTH